MRAPTGVFPDDDPGAALPGRSAGHVVTTSRPGVPFARSLPFLEQAALYNAINFDLTYSDAAEHDGLMYTPLAFLYCPSDPGIAHRRRSLGGTGDATTSYGTCDGDWYVWSVNWDGGTNTVGPMNRSLFGPNYARRIAMSPTGRATRWRPRRALSATRQMRSCVKHAHRRPRTPSPGPILTPTSRSRSGLARGPGLSDQQLRHRDRQSQGGRARSATPAGPTAASITRASPRP